MYAPVIECIYASGVYVHGFFSAGDIAKARAAHGRRGAQTRLLDPSHHSWVPEGLGLERLRFFSFKCNGVFLRARLRFRV